MLTLPTSLKLKITLTLVPLTISCGTTISLKIQRMLVYSIYLGTCLTIYCETDIAYIDKIANNSDEHNEEHGNLKLLKQSDWDEHNYILEKRLNSLTIPHCVNCRDVHCENPKHIEDIDNYAFSIMKSMDESIKMITLKNVKNKKKSKIIPGWNDLVKPYKEALF